MEKLYEKIKWVGTFAICYTPVVWDQIRVGFKSD